MPTVSSKQDQIDALTSRINLADDSLQAFRAYLASPKFTGGSDLGGCGASDLGGYIAIEDVEARLGEIWRELHGIN